MPPFAQPVAVVAFAPALAAAGVTALAVMLGRRFDAFRRAINYEGRSVPVAGVTLAAGLTAGMGLLALSGAPEARAALVAALGFAAFGWLDDRFGDRSASGFSGHLRAAREGRLTTGAWKTVGGGLAALLAAWLLPGATWWRVPLDGVAIALSANAINLLDTRPARAVAVALALFAAAGLTVPSAALGVGAAGALAFLPWDRSRRAMLGDAGSNPLGAVWGVAVVARAPWGGVAAVLALLVAFHALTERRSLNALIARCRPLDRLDRLIRGG